MTEAVIVASYGREVRVLMGGGIVTASVSGRLRLDRFPVTGDRVMVSVTRHGCSVDEVLPRRNSLRRGCTEGTQVLAANVDLLLLLVSVNSPPLHRGFIDRTAAAASFDGIPVTVCLNKIDLAAEEEKAGLDALERDCRAAEMGFLRMSCATGEGVRLAAADLKGRQAVLVGPSGAGKTSFVRALGGPERLKTGDLNARTGKGTHTTVAAVLIPLPGGTAIIDTPGLRVFPLDHIPPTELQFCFKDFAGLQDGCRFRNCMHRNEPGCAVRDAAADGRLSVDRYDSYLQLLGELSGG